MPSEGAGERLLRESWSGESFAPSQVHLILSGDLLMHHRILWIVAAGTLACAPKGDSVPKTSDSALPAAAAAPPVVNITARDFAFDAPDSIPAGLTTIRLNNTGTTIHHVQIVHLADGKTFVDFEAGLKSMKLGDPFPAWSHEIGGPNVAGPGMTVETTQQLDAGSYALICFVDLPDRVPHFSKGMMKPLTITATTAPAAAAPVADVDVTLSDYAFAFTPTLSAGKHTLKISNAAAQPHEFVLLKLEAGKTMADFQKWGAKYEGAPPVQAVGGVAALGPGLTSYLPLDLTAGDYVLVCFVRDATDGKSHIMHGMAQQLKVS
jgi:hypothetical protein